MSYQATSTPTPESGGPGANPPPFNPYQGPGVLARSMSSNGFNGTSGYSGPNLSNQPNTATGFNAPNNDRGDNGATASPSLNAKLYPNRIFVGGMSRDTTVEDVRRFFIGYGNVKNVKIITDMEGQSKGYGFVTFESEEEAKRVQCMTNNSVLNERILHVGPAIKRNITPNQPPIGTGFDPNAARPVGVPSYEQLLRFYSSLFPCSDPTSPMYHPSVSPYFQLNVPFMYAAPNLPTAPNQSMTTNQPF